MLTLRLCLVTSVLALGLATSALPVLAQSAGGPPVLAETAPALYNLEFPLSASTAERLSAEGVRILHHYGDGRYLLSAEPSFAAPITASAAAFAKTPDLGVYDVFPELRGALRTLDGDGVFDSTAKTAETPTTRAAHLELRSSDSPRFPVDLVLAFPGAAAYLKEVLAKADFQTDAQQVEGGVSLRGTVTAAGLRQLIGHPYLLDASAVIDDVIPYSDFPLWEHRVTVLNSAAPGHLNLNGEGVVIGIGDGGKLSDHPDVAGRILHSTPWYNAGWGSHPDFVTSLAGGAGTLNPRYRGTASKAKFVIESSSGITYYGPTYFADYGMTITNNSYGPSYTCQTGNRYYGTSASIDQQLRDNPKLTHVYAVGNSGRAECDSVAGPYSRIPAGAQCAKNSISVGNATGARDRYVSSSSGPTFDGRLKPEIIAVGHMVTGNDRTATYTQGSGTSLSAPAVVGMLALFTEQYKKLHHDSLPDGALLKAVACNTADDMGTPGPDFENGFGMISGTGGVRTLTQGDHREAAVTMDVPYRHTLQVAAGVEQLKVMLYWHDHAGPTQNSTATLVDDLDLYLLTPAGDTLHPWVLDALRPAAEAIRGRDSLNNIEQVTLSAPAPGTYQLVVRGRKQPYGKTDFALTWAALQPSVQIVQPVGGDSFDPSVGIPIAWECSPAQTGNWKVEYAETGVAEVTKSTPTTARSAWQLIHESLDVATQSINWVPPGQHARYTFRVTNLATGLAHELEGPVTAYPTPTDLRATDVCAGRMRLDWLPVDDAASYEVFSFNGTEMASVAQVTSPEALIGDLAEDEPAYFSVLAVDAHGNKSTRAVALASRPAAGGSTCASPLPVVWTALEAADLLQGVRVSWGVAQEQNTDYFELQRSTRGGSVEGDWQAIGTLAARGNATSPAVYSLDDEGVIAGQAYYYRVRQFDLGGDYSDSQIIVHRCADSSIAGDLFAVTQNPIGDALVVNYGAGQSARLDIYDLAGRRLADLTLTPGKNHLVWPPHLSRGMYVLRVADRGRVQSLRVVKG